MKKHIRWFSIVCVAVLLAFVTINPASVRADGELWGASLYNQLTGGGTVYIQISNLQSGLYEVSFWGKYDYEGGGFLVYAEDATGMINYNIFMPASHDWENYSFQFQVVDGSYFLFFVSTPGEVGGTIVVDGFTGSFFEDPDFDLGVQWGYSNSAERLNGIGHPAETPPTATATSTATNTPTDTQTITLTPSDTPTITLTPSDTPTITLTPSETPTITLTPTETPTLTPTETLTPTITLTPTATELYYVANSFTYQDVAFTILFAAMCGIMLLGFGMLGITQIMRSRRS